MNKSHFYFQHIFQELKLEYKSEHKFLENRKFRFDYAIPQLKIGIEYEGLFSNKSRHTTVSGYTKDTEKYNLAVLNGWRVLRYTAINLTQFENDIKILISEQK